MKRPRMAVALSCDPSQREAPVVSLRAESYLAEKVVQLARRYRIPVVERPAVVKLLENLEIDSEIPPKLFKTVAILLAELDQRGLLKS